VKQTMAFWKEPERVLFEIRKLSYASSAATLFAVPTNCTKISGTTNANGGHAEISVDVSAQGQTGVGNANPAKKAAPIGNPMQLLGKWSFTGKDGAGVQWTGTLTVGKLDQDTLSQGKYSNSCDLDVSSGNSGKGVSGACLYDGRTKTLTFASDWGPSQYSITAVLTSDGKSLTQGRWVDSTGLGTWSATAGSAPTRH
jgi:hypothetical protein